MRGSAFSENEPVLVRVYLPASELGAVLTEDLRRAMEAFPQVELIAKPLAGVATGMGLEQPARPSA